MNFSGTAAPLSKHGVDYTCARLDIEPAHLWGVLEVETEGCGFDRERRPQVLFERHVFHRETGGRFDSAAPEISSATAGGYNRGGSQYERLAIAIALDSKSALRSTSWGLGQVMGFNFDTAGYASTEEMIESFMLSEDLHLAGMTSFIEGRGIVDSLRKGDWNEFARLYNGADYARHGYHIKLENAVAEYKHTRPLPDTMVRGSQLALLYLGHLQRTWQVDGVMGKRTASALLQFQHSTGIHPSGICDEPTVAALWQAVGWQ